MNFSPHPFPSRWAGGVEPFSLREKGEDEGEVFGSMAGS